MHQVCSGVEVLAADGTQDELLTGEGLHDQGADVRFADCAAYGAEPVYGLDLAAAVGGQLVDAAATGRRARWAAATSRAPMLAWMM